MEKFKLVFTGSVAAGKTTAIQAISEVDTISTEVRPSEESILRQKPTTTIAMDYGQVTLEGNEKLHLYGTPGQRRFDFMCSILCEGALGLIILINNSHEDVFTELDYYLNLNAAFLSKNPAVIGVTHYDEVNTPSIKAYQQYLHERGDAWPVLRADARDINSVAVLIETLMFAMEYAVD
ncbi:MAG: GTP-binding protein [Methyloprofundus sp.]|nr:GTP-binding protein [Methyloprofundus sp.]